MTSTLVAFVSTIFINIAFRFRRLTDPDAYYHLSFSRFASNNLIPKEWMQFPDISWSRFFEEKEFLFHLLTSTGYKLWGENGVWLTVYTLQFGIFFMLLVLAYKFANTKYTIITFFAIVICGHPFMWRISLLRPQLAGILFFLFIIHALLIRNRTYLVISSALFTLSYHLIVIPLATLSVFLFTSWYFHKKNLDYKLPVWGCIGIFSGVLANPYFPGQLVVAYEQFMIIFYSFHKVKLPYGNETYPTITNHFFEIYLPCILLLIIGNYQYTKKHATLISAKKLEEVSLIFFLTILFFPILFYMPRMIEYLLPVQFLLGVWSISNLSSKKKLLYPIMSLLFLSQLQSYKEYYNTLTNHDKFPKAISDKFEVLDSLPSDDTTYKVYNCSWSDSPYIIYKRPKSQVVDVLAPSFLFYKDKELYSYRSMLNMGKYQDVYFVLREIFNSDYVFCGGPLVGRINLDPRFKKLSKKGGLYLYKIDDQWVPNFVKHYAVSRQVSKDKIIAEEGLFDESNFQEVFHYDKLDYKRANPVYWDLRSSKKWNTKQEEVQCAIAKVSDSEIERLAGKLWMSVGGGSNLKVYRNTKLLYQNVRKLPRVLLHTWIKLERPLEKTDKVHIVTCGKKADFNEISASFWNFEEIKTMCNQKEDAVEKMSWVTNAKAKYVGLDRPFCLGRMAIKGNYL